MAGTAASAGHRRIRSEDKAHQKTPMVIIDPYLQHNVKFSFALQESSNQTHFDLVLSFVGICAQTRPCPALQYPRPYVPVNTKAPVVCNFYQSNYRLEEYMANDVV